MKHHRSDPFIDLAYSFALLTVLVIFSFSFFSLFGSIRAETFVTGEDALTGVVRNASRVAKGAFFSVFIFVMLLFAAIVFHELGHFLGGILKGYRPAHLCLFGVILSFKGERRIRSDRSARFGGYVVMCPEDQGRSPVMLIRMGPLFECMFFVTVAVVTGFGESTVAGVFLLGEILSYLFVRILASGHSAEDDSSTVAEVRQNGPEDYNRLMNIYDREISGAGRNVPGDRRSSREERSVSSECGSIRVKRTSSTPHTRGKSTNHDAGSETSRRQRSKYRETLTVREELSLYGKED